MVDGRSMKSRWLVPQNGVNANTVYKGRPFGNSPEFMPLDNSLNNDIKSSLNRHCCVTSHLTRDDKRRFSNSTPKKISEGIHRLMEPEEGEGVPCSERMMHDCDKALESMRKVYLHHGAIVEGLADRNGIRYSTDGTGQHGGKREKSFLLVDLTC